jgi:hypothetical protein
MMQDIHLKLHPGLPYHGKSSIQQEEDCHQQTGFKFREKASKILHLEHKFCMELKLKTYWKVDKKYLGIFF